MYINKFLTNNIIEVNPNTLHKFLTPDKNNNKYHVPPLKSVFALAVNNGIEAKTIG